jgi:hypothetical protein
VALYGNWSAHRRSEGHPPENGQRVGLIGQKGTSKAHSAQLEGKASARMRALMAFIQPVA